MIYLDNNATSLLAPAVVERMEELSRRRLANPSSQHAAGRTARGIVESARERLLTAVGAHVSGMQSDQLLFTSGGTEANNLALFGIADSLSYRAATQSSDFRGSPVRIIVSAIEHPSVLGAAERLETLGHRVDKISVDERGVVSVDHLVSLLKQESAVSRTSFANTVVSVMSANNETGVVQPLESIGTICREYGAVFHCDAVQSLGKDPISFRELQIDLMTITAHKLQGPVGIGALVVRNGISVLPQLFGGYQQLGLRPGTETPVLSDAFAFAVERFISEERSLARMRSLRDRLELGIVESIENAIVVGGDAPRLPHTLSIAFPGVDRQALQVSLDLRGIACSTGSACASGSSQPSHVLLAMGLSEGIVQGGIRFSLSADNTEVEIDETIEVLKEIIPNLRKIHGRSASFLR